MIEMDNVTKIYRLGVKQVYVLKLWDEALKAATKNGFIDVNRYINCLYSYGYVG